MKERTVLKRIHPLLVEEIERVHKKMSDSLGPVPASIPSKVIAEQLRNMQFVESLEVVNVRLPKKRRTETMFDLRIFK